MLVANDVIIITTCNMNNLLWVLVLTILIYRFIFEEDADPYSDALASQRATFVPYLRKSTKEDIQDRVDAYGWTLPRIMFPDTLEESVKSGSSDCSLPPQVAALACCRPVSYQEEVSILP